MSERCHGREQERGNYLFYQDGGVAGRQKDNSNPIYIFIGVELIYATVLILKLTFKFEMES